MKLTACLYSLNLHAIATRLAQKIGVNSNSQPLLESSSWSVQLCYMNMYLLLHCILHLTSSLLEKYNLQLLLVDLQRCIQNIRLHHWIAIGIQKVGFSILANTIK